MVIRERGAAVGIVEGSWVRSEGGGGGGRECSEGEVGIASTTGRSVSHSSHCGSRELLLKVHKLHDQVSVSSKLEKKSYSRQTCLRCSYQNRK